MCHPWLIVGSLLLVAHIAMTAHSSDSPTACSADPSEITVVGIQENLVLDAAHPAPAWSQATPVSFCADWQGKNADLGRQTSVRALWSPTTLYLRFECRYREVYVFEDAESNGRRDHLWDRDVAEAFLQPDSTQLRFYKEFEVSPNGFWIDLDISPGGLANLRSGLHRSVSIDHERKFWAAELAIPLASITGHFDPNVVWRANFYRVEGPEPRRFYSAWRPTNSPEPNFHVPTAFGRLRFSLAANK
jgi:alpha-galactosidase